MTFPTAFAAKPRTHTIATVLFAALFLASALALAPATAYADKPVVTVVDDPRTHVDGMSIWTTGSTSDWVEESKTNLTKDTKNECYWLEAKKGTGDLTLRYRKAAITNGGDTVDFVVKYVWTREDNLTHSEKTMAYHYGTHQVKFCGQGTDGNKVFPYYGCTITETINAYKTGTTTPVSGDFQLYWDDIDSTGVKDGEHISGYHLNDPWMESLELVKNFTNEEYIGKAIPASAGHEDGTEKNNGKVLNYGEKNGHPFFYGSHTCHGYADSSVSFLAHNGFACKMYGWGGQGMHVGFTVNGSGGNDRRPKATVRFHANGGTVGDTDNYRLSNGILQEKKNGAWTTKTNTLLITDDHKDLWNAVSGAGLTKTGYHVVDNKSFDPDDNKENYGRYTKLDSTNYYYIGNNKSNYYYFNPNNTAKTDKNPVTTLSLNNGTQITTNKTFTVYVKWMPNHYRVNFIGNGNTSGLTETPQDFWYTRPQELNANGYKKTGYSFLRWNSKANGSGTNYADKSSQVNLTSDREGAVDMYAQWTPNSYSIRYTNMEGATFVNSTQPAWPTRVSYDSTFTVSQAAKPGHVFKGWKISNMTGGDTHVFGRSSNPKTTTTATNVDLVAMKASGSWSNQAFPENAPGYYKNLRCDNSTKLDDAVVFEAQWEPISYNIEYVLNGGAFAAGTSHPSTAKYDQWITVDNPTRYAYDFKGWRVTGLTSGDTHLYGASTTSYSATTATEIANTFERIYRNLRIQPGTVRFEASWEPKHVVELYVDDFDEPWQTLFVDVGDGEPWWVPDSYTEAARKWDCHHTDGTQGLEAWYWDEELENEFEPQPLEKDVTKLYAKNFATVTYAHGAGSDIAEEYMIKDPDTGKFKKTGTIDELAKLQQPFEVSYGTVAGLSSKLDKLRLYYENPTIPDALPLTNRAEEGWHSTYGCDAEDSFSRVKITGDATVYKLWQTSTYDRITTYLI